VCACVCVCVCVCVCACVCACVSKIFIFSQSNSWKSSNLCTMITESCIPINVIFMFIDDTCFKDSPCLPHIMRLVSKTYVFFSGWFLNYFSKHPMIQKENIIIELTDRVLYLLHPIFQQKNFDKIIRILFNNYLLYTVYI